MRFSECNPNNVKYSNADSSATNLQCEKMKLTRSFLIPYIKFICDFSKDLPTHDSFKIFNLSVKLFDTKHRVAEK